MRTGRIALSVTIAGVALLIVPQAAWAATFCVYSPPGCSGTPETTIAAAFTAAGLTPLVKDRIEVGPGTHSEDGLAALNNPIDLVGVGSPAPTITRSPSNGASVLRASDATSTVTNLKLAIPGGNNLMRGLMIGGIADGVTVTEGAGADDSLGVLFEADNATLRNSTITLGFTGGMAGTTSTGVRTINAGGLIEDSKITAGTAISVEAPPTTTVRRVDVLGVRGVEATGGITNLSSSLIRVAPQSQSEGGGITVGVRTQNSVGSTATTNASNITVIGAGTSEDGITAQTGGPAGSQATTNVRNAVIRGFGLDDLFSEEDLGNGTASINIDYSDYDTTNTQMVGGGTLTEGTHNINNPPSPVPGFLNAPAGDYRLLSSSPLIDKGDPASPGAGQSTTDLAGKTRARDGDGNSTALVDIGAFEYQPVPPTAVKDTVAPVITDFRARPRSFATGLARAAAKKGTIFRYTLSEAAGVVLTIERKSSGRRVGSKCRRKTRSNRRRRHCTLYRLAGTLPAQGAKGANSTRFSGKLGGRRLRRASYRATLVATDAAGNASKPARASFKVKRRKHR